MSETTIEILLMMLMWANGLMLGYLIWSPTTNFKQGLIRGLTFAPLFNWIRKR